MKTILLSILATAMFSFALLAQDSTIQKLPDKLSIDITKPHFPHSITITLEDGRVVVIRLYDNSKDSVTIDSGDNSILDSKVQHLIIYPAASNSIRISTAVSTQTHNDLIKQTDEQRKK